MIAVYIVVTAPWHLFALLSSGSVLPNTFRANFRGLATRVVLPGYFTNYLRWLFLRDHPWAYWLVVPGVFEVVRASARGDGGRAMRGEREPGTNGFGLALLQLSALWVVFYPLVMRIVLPMTRHHNRYMIPLAPFHAILAAAGAAALVKWGFSVFRRAGGGRFSQPASFSAAWAGLCLAMFLSAVPGLVRWAAVYGRNVYSIDHQHVAMARWVRDHTPPGAVVAAHDIGALGAIAKRRVVDIFGLVTPSMIHRVNTIIPTLSTAADWYLEKLYRAGAGYVVGYPDWLPFVRAHPRCFREIHREVLADVDICGGREMVLYRMDRSAVGRILSRRR